MDNYLEQLLHEASDAILVSDGKGIITFWNRAAELIFGYLWLKPLASHST